uniref:Uncharacterized protein n=1 Tax=Siphoviridae sp. ctoRD1 TaxID=2825669 RepID=A0A8S5QF47_9CAUD|nr:MAG TPA: hypothetical protein [Siphoviridae sp. ctoRD1]
MSPAYCNKNHGWVIVTTVSIKIHNRICLFFDFNTCGCRANVICYNTVVRSKRNR